jgi:hypothetical protein
MHYCNFLALDKSWDNVRSSAAPYTESRLPCSAGNEHIGLLVVEHLQLGLYLGKTIENAI